MSPLRRASLCSRMAMAPETNLHRISARGPARGSTLEQRGVTVLRHSGKQERSGGFVGPFATWSQVVPSPSRPDLVRATETGLEPTRFYQRCEAHPKPKNLGMSQAADLMNADMMKVYACNFVVNLGRAWG